MFLFLRKRYEECPNKNWFNFEDEICRYVSSLGDDVSEKDVAADRTYYNALCHDLMCSSQILAFSVPYVNTPEYIRENGGNRNEVNPAYRLHGKPQSIANRMLDFISINPTYFDSIISFNYTDFGNLLLLRVAGNVNYNQQDIEFFKTKIMNRVHFVHLRKEESGRSSSGNPADVTTLSRSTPGGIRTLSWNTKLYRFSASRKRQRPDLSKSTPASASTRRTQTPKLEEDEK